MDAVRSKRPEKCRTNSLFLFHDNAPAHQSGLVDDFLANNNDTTLQIHPYSPYLAAADFFLFPPLKLALKGWRVCNDTDIIKNAKEELKRLLKYVFHECFQQCYGLCINYQLLCTDCYLFVKY